MNDKEFTHEDYKRTMEKGYYCLNWIVDGEARIQFLEDGDKVVLTKDGAFKLPYKNIK